MLSPSLNTSGSIPKTYGQVTGVLAPRTSTMQPFYPTPTGTPIQQGTNTGMLPYKSTTIGNSTYANLGNADSAYPTPTTAIKSTTSPTGTISTYHAPTPNESVLAQQKALNKLGAGLIEDGISGPKTRAALAQYGSQLYGTKSNTPTTSSVAPLTVGGQIPGLLQSGQPTDWENQVRGGSAVQDANDALTKFRMEEAKKFGDIESQAIPLEFQQGREQVLQRQAASQEAALQTGVSNALANQGQQFSAAQAQAQRGLGAAGTAVGAVAPITGIPYGTQMINPATGQPYPGTGGDFSQALQSYAQMAANGQYSAIPSSITGNPVLNAQLNQMAQGINPNYNPVTSNAYGGIATEQSQQVAQYKSALQQGQNLQSQFTDLITTFGLNPSNINAVNLGLQAIANNTSNPYYKQLHNYINDIANTYAQILTPPGGSATDTTRGIATSMLDSTAQGSSLINTMKSLDEAAKAKIAGVPTPYNGGSSSSSGGATFGWDGN